MSTQSPTKVYKYVKVVQIAKPQPTTTSTLVPVRVISAGSLPSVQQKVVVQQPVVIKQEPVDVEELTVECRLCSKTFYNPIALKNHVTNMHMDVEVDTSDWCVEFYEKQKEMKQREEAINKPVVTQQVLQKKLVVRPREKLIYNVAAVEQKKAEVLANMKPINIDSLVKEEFNYLLLRAEDDDAQDRDEGEPSDEIKKKQTKRRKRKYSIPEDGTEKHIRNRSGELRAVPDALNGPFECNEPSTLSGDGLCHQIFFSCCQYSIHYRDEHTRRRKHIRCQVCEKLLLSNNDELSSPYVCQTCGAGYNNHRDLIEHSSTTHIKIKPFHCTECNKKFTQLANLNQHLRWHRGERPFPCTVCQKAFTQKAGLDQHMRIHTKEKPYKCIVCSKAFIQSIHLKQHMRTHTNLAPFQCIICQKRFKQASHLNYHFRYHSEDSMTDSQKETYNSLMGTLQESFEIEIKSEDVQNLSEQNEAIEQVIVESDQMVIQDDREYILSDNGDETWSVKVVDRVDDVE